MTANTLGESGMSIPPAFTSTRKRTRSNCARAINPKTIDATSDAGFFIFSAPRWSRGEHGPRPLTKARRSIARSPTGGDRSARGGHGQGRLRGGNGRSVAANMQRKDDRASTSCADQLGVLLAQTRRHLDDYGPPPVVELRVRGPLRARPDEPDVEIAPVLVRERPVARGRLSRLEPVRARHVPPCAPRPTGSGPMRFRRGTSASARSRSGRT